jgi:hypothetical protein
MWQRRPQRVSTFLASLLFCAALKASPLVELQLDAPPECPSKTSIEQTLARLVQRPPAAPLQVSARLASDAQRWVLVATLEGGQRVVGGDTCVATAEALVVIMALAIDPASPVNASALQDFEQANTGNAQPTRPPTPPMTPAAPMPPPVSIAVAPNSGGKWRMSEAEAQDRIFAPPRHPRKPERLGMSLLLLGEWGSLPEASLGLALFVRYGSPLRWGELSVSGLYPRIKYETGSNTKGARFGLVTSQLAGCAAPGYGWPVAGCVGVEFGDLFGHGDGTDSVQTGHSLWAALTAGVAYRGELGGNFGLEWRLGAAIPVQRPDFDVQNSGRIFTPGLVSLRGLVGVSWR